MTQGAYRAELYAHRIDRTLVGLIRSALRHGIKDDGQKSRDA